MLQSLNDTLQFRQPSKLAPKCTTQVQGFAFPAKVDERYSVAPTDKLSGAKAGKRTAQT